MRLHFQKEKELLGLGFALLSCQGGGGIGVLRKPVLQTQLVARGEERPWTVCVCSVAFSCDDYILGKLKHLVLTKAISDFIVVTQKL